MINRVIALLLTAFFSLFLLIVPWQTSNKGIPPGSPIISSARFFPRFLAFLGCLLSLVLLVRSISKSAASNELYDVPKKANLLRIAGVNGILCFYLLTFNLLGYLVSTSLSLIFLMAFLGLKDIKYYVLIIAVLPAVLYYLFKKMLYVAFPIGIFGF